MKNKRQANTRESGTVHFKTIDGIQFWVTPQNQIFLVNAKTGQQVYPSGGEDQLESLPPAVSKEMKWLQTLQAAIRKEWDEEDKDSPDAWTFSDDPDATPSRGAYQAVSESRGYSHRSTRIKGLI